MTRKTWDDGIFRTNPVRCIIVADNKCLQQVENFKYLGCEIFFKNEKDIQQKLTKFLRIEVCNALVVPILVLWRRSWDP